MEVLLTLSSGSLSGAPLQDLTRQLCTTLNRETDVAATTPEAAADDGSKGDLISLGTLLLTFMTSGAAVALFEVAKAFFERDSSLVLELERPDGAKFVVRGENVGRGQIDKTIETARRFLEGTL